MEFNERMGKALRNVLQKQNASNPHRDDIIQFVEDLKTTMNDQCFDLKQEGQFFRQEVPRFKDGENFHYKLWIIMNGRYLNPKVHPDGLPLVKLFNMSTQITSSSIISCCNEENELLLKKVHSWLKGLVNRCLQKMDSSKKPDAMISITENDYSFTLILKFPQGKTAFIQLIPALKKPNLNSLRILQKPTKELFYCPSNYCLARCKKDTWCLHPLKNEYSPLDKKTNASMIFIAIKKIGENKNFSALNDYIFLAQFSKMQFTDAEWQDDSLGATFLKYLEGLMHSIHSGFLPHPHFPNYNLLKGISNPIRKTMEEELKTIAENYKRRPPWIQVVLLGSSPYPPLSALKDIQAKTKIDEKEKTRNIKVLYDVLKIIQERAKCEDIIFENLFSRIEYTGSYYENLKVLTPDEFDLNFVFNFPLVKYLIKDFSDPNLIVYKKIQYEAPYEDCLSPKNFSQNVKDVFKKFFNSENFFSRSAFTRWFISTIDKVLSKENKSNKFRDCGIMSPIVRSEHGPACTLNIKVPASGDVPAATIDVDFVPVFEFPYERPYPRGHRSNFPFPIEESKKKWMLVPKPVKGVKDDTLWRVHFLLIEKYILEIKQSPKPIIRLIKLLRDTRNWKQIASYFIKCLAMHWVEKTWADPDYWKEENMPVALIEMLEELVRCLKKKKLCSYCFPTYNLLQGINPECLKNIAFQLEKMLPYIAKNPTPFFLKECRLEGYENIEAQLELLLNL